MDKPCEIIFVDDGSCDRTLEKLDAVKKKERQGGYNNLETKIIKFSRNLGQTAALQAGFDHAKSEIIVSLDGDLQNDPADITILIGKLNQRDDMVFWRRKERKNNF